MDNNNMINKNMTNEAYHAHKSISASGVKTLLKNPHEFLNPTFKASKAFDLGSATHSLVLEPHKFDSEFAVAPEINKRTKAGKEEWAEFEEQNKDKTVISQEDYDKAKGMATSVHNLNLPFLQNGIAECSYFSSIDGVDVKCRPDYYIEGLGFVVDLKTCEDASLEGFTKSVANFGYHTQASFYLQTLRSMDLKADKFIFIAVEKKAPYMVGVYELDAKALQKGDENIAEAFEILQNIDRFKEPVYKEMQTYNKVQTIQLPPWAK